MQLDRALISFPLFLFFFFASFGIRFEGEIFSDGPGGSPGSLIFALLVLSAIFLAVTLASVFRVRLVQMSLFTLLLTVGLFLGISRYEDQNVEREWLKSSSLDEFTKVQGHCYPKLGKTVLGILDRSLKSRSTRFAREQRINAECRLKHFKFLQERGALSCEVGVGASLCVLRWVKVFGQAGQWDYQTRSFWFERMMEQWQRDHDNETLVNYVIKDQEFYALAANDGEKDQNFLLNRSIFDKVAECIRDNGPKSKPEPYQFKFKEAYSDFLTHLRN